MIPKIAHSRSQLRSHLNEYDDGASSLFVSSDTYPELFEHHFPDIVKKAPKGWHYKKMAYLWFPPDKLEQADLENIKAWRDKFERYVLIGLNSHIEDFFSNELDFCMALDFNIDPSAQKRTVFGEAEYQLKYQISRQHLQILVNGLADAVADLPIPMTHRDSLCISCVPGSPDEASVQFQLASGVAKKLGVDFVDADLRCDKPDLKGVNVEEKIPIWQRLYDEGCIDLSSAVQDRLVIVIDDLYQSGATMWMYAKYLKSQGAQHVFGLPCVKSLRDTDNQ